MYPTDIPANLEANYTYLLPARRAGSQLIYGYGDFSTAPLPTQSDTTTFMNYVQMRGLMSWAHILGTTGQKATADGYAAATGAHFDGYMVSAVSTVVPAGGSLAPTGIPSAEGIGHPRLTLPSPIALRDTLSADNTAAAQSTFTIPLPTTLVDQDWGVVLLVWSSGSGTPLAGLTTSWQVLVPPTVANQICFAVIAKQYVAGTDTLVDVRLDVPRYLLAVGAWYAVVHGTDLPGPVGINPSSVLSTAVAPSANASGATYEQMFAMFASGIRSVPPTVTADRGSVVVSTAGVPNTVMGTIASFGVVTVGPTGDVTATYSLGGQSRAGVQIGLLATGSLLGGAASFGPTVTLAATGKQLLRGTPAFGVDVRLAVRGVPGSVANFGPTVSLGARGQSINQIALGPTVTLAVTGARVGRAAFGANVTLSTTGLKIGTRNISLGPTVTLSARGVPRFTGQAAFGTTVTLATLGKATLRGQPFFGTTIGLAATGRPAALGVRAAFGPTMRLFTQNNLVRVSGTAATALNVTLRAVAARMVVGGQAALGVSVTLTAVGTKYEPVQTVTFTPTVTLAVDGFARAGEPVGITIKPHPVQPDPVWHGTPKSEYDWDVDTTVGDADFGTTVTLAATGRQLVSTFSAHTWSVDE